jgi:hypothetical protein
LWMPGGCYPLLIFIRNPQCEKRIEIGCRSETASEAGVAEGCGVCMLSFVCSSDVAQKPLLRCALLVEAETAPHPSRGLPSSLLPAPLLRAPTRRGGHVISGSGTYHCGCCKVGYRIVGAYSIQIMAVKAFVDGLRFSMRVDLVRDVPSWRAGEACCCQACARRLATALGWVSA